VVIYLHRKAAVQTVKIDLFYTSNNARIIIWCFMGCH